LLPWSAPEATVQLLHLVELEEIQAFLTLQELDNEFDAWPELGSPFILIDISELPWNQSKNGITSLNQNQRKQFFFIAYSQARSLKHK
jgi:hypothetical protein